MYILFSNNSQSRSIYSRIVLNWSKAEIKIAWMSNRRLLKSILTCFFTMCYSFLQINSIGRTYPPEVGVLQKSVLKSFSKSIGKDLMKSQARELQLDLKKDSRTGVFLRILWNLTLTANYDYSRSNREYLPLPIQMQLSKKPKTFSKLLIAFLECTLNFKH